MTCLLILVSLSFQMLRRASEDRYPVSAAYVIVPTLTGQQADVWGHI